ncbi:PREDICTED: UDP-glucuronosyltransferase 2B31-like [Propithecus coquereli]|uniref:UDP-glucuronosyltransferase 2B31-like n=1 Tax=Propithecus coquereli TaxID=379532 RepID=UPI00063EFFC1|nr:PREDICTED: UDP-glucuronosyltransferase 2B31-like [Propithecus coquereli]
MALRWTSVLLLIQLSGYFSPGTCGKVLVWPTEYSHWRNMKIILDELVQRGHEVTVLASSVSVLIDPSKTSAIKFEVFPTSLSKDDFEGFLMKLLDRAIYDLPKDTFGSHASKIEEIMWEFSEVLRQLCKDAVLNKKLMTKLQESKFDVLLADGVGQCADLLAEILKTPLVYSLRFSPGYTIEKHIGGLPLPPSYVPVAMSELSDRMTFMERVKNMIFVLYFDFWFQGCDMKKWDQFYLEVLGNMIVPDMEDFVQSSGESGVVVFSLGSMISNMTEERANVIASALAQIPQKVRQTCHPKTKAFITHGGANGVYEAIYHGVPMVGIPLFADQPDNIAHMKTKGAAVRVDFNTMSSTDLLNALKTVINDPMHLRVAAHDLTWFQYHSLDVIGFLLACVATVVFIITKCCLFFCRMFATAGKKNKRE